LIVANKAGTKKTATKAAVAKKPVASAGSAKSHASAVQDVNAMPVVSPGEAAKIKAAAGIKVAASPTAALAAVAVPERAVKPGKERWDVKTGTDPDVGKVVPKIVPTTVEELVSIARPSDMSTPTREYPAYQNHRAAPVETTIWRVDAQITVLKRETDQDFHLVLQGASGKHMIGEIPRPGKPWVPNTSPWLANITAARTAAAQKLLKQVSTKNLVAVQGKLVPRESLAVQPDAASKPPDSLADPEDGTPAVAFESRIDPVHARITGVGFFDAVHGQTGVAPSGIELHPILKIEWL
jgi:hypothetical protein